jgi:hypothetical protein
VDITSSFVILLAIFFPSCTGVWAVLLLLRSSLFLRFFYFQESWLGQIVQEIFRMHRSPSQLELLLPLLPLQLSVSFETSVALIAQKSITVNLVGQIALLVYDPIESYKLMIA